MAISVYGSLISNNNNSLITSSTGYPAAAIKLVQKPFLIIPFIEFLDGMGLHTKSLTPEMAGLDIPILSSATPLNLVVSVKISDTNVYSRFRVYSGSGATATMNEGYDSVEAIEVFTNPENNYEEFGIVIYNFQSTPVSVDREVYRLNLPDDTTLRYIARFNTTSVRFLKYIGAASIPIIYGAHYYPNVTTVNKGGLNLDEIYQRI